MSRLSFRDRFFTRPVAHAITSPLSIVLFGTGTALAIVAGLGLAAPFVGLGAWVVRVGLAIPRHSSRERIDPYTLSEPWRQQVLQAQSSVARFGRVVAKALAGPTKDRLSSMATRLDDGLVDCWRIANRGDELDAAITDIDTRAATAQLAELKASVRHDGATASSQQTLDALQAQLDSAQRLQATRQDAADRLRLLNARFDEIVARAVEVSVGTGDSGGLDDDVTGLVTDLEALRLAIEEVGQVSGTTSSGSLPAAAPTPTRRPDAGPGTTSSAPGS